MPAPRVPGALRRCGGAMTKSGLIEKVAEQTPHISKKDTEVVVNTIFDSMTEALKEGERIEIRGFGSFQVKLREAREGRNPKTLLNAGGFRKEPPTSVPSATTCICKATLTAAPPLLPPAVFFWS